MSIVCNSCGKSVSGEGVVFCPYCGARLPAAAKEPEVRNEEAEKWIRKAMAVSSYPKRKEILLKGLSACPGSREIEWELLFVGEEGARRGKVFDFSVIKSWVLEIYWKPENFPEEKRDRMRSWFFDAPELKECLSRFGDPEEKQREYLLRLCREYVELFLEGSNQVMGNVFGFQIERNRAKKLAVPVAKMIARIKADEKLLPEQREQLWKALYQGYASRTEGKTEHLDQLLSQNG